MTTLAIAGDDRERALGILDRAGFDSGGAEAQSIVDVFLMGRASARMRTAVVAASDDLYRLRLKATHSVAPLLDESAARVPIEDEFVDVLAMLEVAQMKLGNIVRATGLAVSAIDKRIDG